MVKITGKIIDFYYKHEQKVLKSIPVIGLIVILVITFVLHYSDVPFLINISNAKRTLLELFSFSNKLQLVRNIVVVITICSGYVYWLKRYAIIRKNSRLIKSIIFVISLLIFTEHINLNSPVGQFVDWAFFLAVAYLLLAGFWFLLDVEHSIDLSSYRSKPKDDSKALDYISDAEITDPALDKFKRWPFAQSIVEKIALRHDTNSIVFGIYGAWGEGKSTVLNFIEIGLKNEPNIVCIRFNPWRFDDETNLLRNFFQTLADGLGKPIYSPNEKIEEWIKNYAANLSFTISGAVQLSRGEVGKNVSSLELDELKNRIGELLKNEGKHIVILIDDIDRLDKTEIQIIFKLVKLSANFTNTTYVLAFDEDMVSEALGENYGSGDKEAGRSFIEKIVQVPLYLPKADTMALRKVCFEYVDEILKDSKINLTQEQNQAFVTKFIDCFETRLHTPRMATRYANALLFSLPLLKGEVNHVDLMLIEGTKIFYPKLYEVIRNNPNVFLCSWENRGLMKEHSIKIIDEGLDGLNNSYEKQCAKNLLHSLFPLIDEIYGNTSYAPEWDDRWAKEQRIASEQYFSRFFSYAVSEGDISDIELEYFIKRIENDTISNIASEIQKIMSCRSAELFVLKLRRKVNMLSSDASSNLAVAITKVGDIFPKSEGRFRAATAFSQAGYLVSQLLHQILIEKDRFDAAKTIFQEGSIFFVAECFSWIRTTKERKEQDRIFSAEMENELGRIIVEKLKQFSNGLPLPIYKQYPDDAPYLLYIWLDWGSREETNQYLTKTLEDNPSNALELLNCYLPTGYSASGVQKGGLERDQYNSIVKVVDADVIFNALYKIYGSKIESQKNHTNRNRTSDEWIAYQFVHIHQLVKAEERSATSKKEEHDK